MNILDKLANMVKHVGNASGKESTIFKHLLSMQRCETCCEIYNRHVKPIQLEMGDMLIRLAKDSYVAMHEHCKGEIGEDIKEKQILERLYHQRKLRHGTFLHGEQFRKTFEQSKGTVPNEIMLVAFALTLALCLDPKRFLRLEAPFETHGS